MKYFNYKIISLTLLLSPAMSNAQPEDFKGAAGNVTDILLSGIPLLFITALVVFFWGAAEYVLSAAEDTKDGAKQRMLWGVVGLFVISAIWGIITFLSGSLGITV